MKVPLWKPTGSGSFRKLKDGLYEVRYRPFGSKGPYLKRRVPGKEAEIRELLARQSINRARRRSGLSGILGWTEAIQLYESHIEAKDNTEDYNEKVVELLEEMRDVSGTKHVSDVEPSDVDRWLHGLIREAKENGETGRARTANKKRAMVRAFFRYFYRKRMIDHNPVDATEPFREVKPPPRDLTSAEYALVWHKCEESVQDLMDFLLNTACRFGEAAAMYLTDVNAQGRWTCTNRKGRDYLRLELLPEVLEIIRRQPKTEDGLVWHRWARRKPNAKRGHGWVPGVPIRTEWFDALLKERCTLAGVENFSAHDLRHAASTWARGAGMSPWAVNELLAQSDMNTTAIYAHKTPDRSGAKVVLKELWKIRSKALQNKAS